MSIVTRLLSALALTAVSVATPVSVLSATSNESHISEDRSQYPIREFSDGENSSDQFAGIQKIAQLGNCGSSKWQRLAIRDSWGGANFGPHCAEHDKCYETLGNRKEDCDNQFSTGLRNECKSTYNSVWHVTQKKLCSETANGYHSAVNRMGGDAYRAAQREAKKIASNTEVAFNSKLADGFYRVNSAGVVWWLYNDSKACGIASGAHLDNLGGAGRVKNLPNGADAGFQRSWTGTCKVADGFYRVNSAGVVWRLYTQDGVPKACGVASGAHLDNLGGTGRVKEAPSGVEAGSQRAWADTCPLLP